MTQHALRQLRTAVLEFGRAALLACCVFTLASNVLAQDNYDDAAEVRQSTKQILEKPEYQRLRQLLDEETKENDDFSGQPSASSSSSGDSSKSDWNFKPVDLGIGNVVGSIFVGLAWTCLAVVVVLMVYLIVRALRAARESEFEAIGSPAILQGETVPDRAPGELPADAYIELARRLASEGKFREAVAQLLLGAMSQIERAGWIHFRRGLTYRDYIRATRDHGTAHEALREIVRTYEPLGFGRRPATGEHFIKSLERYEEGFRAIPAPTAN